MIMESVLIRRGREWKTSSSDDVGRSLLSAIRLISIDFMLIDRDSRKAIVPVEIAEKKLFAIRREIRMNPTPYQAMTVRSSLFL